MDAEELTLQWEVGSRSTPSTREDPGTESWGLSCCGQGILSSARPTHLKAGSHLLLGITSALFGHMHTHTEPNLGAPWALVHEALHYKKSWWGCLTHEAHMPSSSRVHLGLLGQPGTGKTLLRLIRPQVESLDLG